MFKRRPRLIDELIADKTNVSEELNGKWYVAKSLPLYGFEGFCERLWHAWLVLTDRARAYEHMCDRIKT